MKAYKLVQEMTSNMMAQYITIKKTVVLFGAASVVCVACADTSTSWWTGSGLTYSTLNEANWEGGLPSTDATISFAQGGNRAELAEDLSVSKLVFDLPDDVPGFTLAPFASDADAKLTLSGGSIIVKASSSGATHTNTISVPIASPKGTLTLNVERAADGLVFNRPILSQDSTADGSVKLNPKGPGKYFFNSTQGAGVATTFNGGTIYVKQGGLGGYMSANPSSAPLYIHYAGGTNNVSCTYTRTSGYDFSIYCDEGTTNYLGFTQIQSTYGTAFNYMTNSHTTFGSTYCPIDPCWRLMNELHADSEVVFKGIVSGKCTYKASGEQQMHIRAYNATAQHRGRVVFAMPNKNKNNVVKEGLFLAGALTVRFDEDFAFDTNTAGYATPLSMMYNNGKPMGVVVDLNGHSQRFGAFRTPPADKEYGWENYLSMDYTAYMTSAIPATVYVRQNEWVNGFAWQHPLCGALSLVKEGTNTLTLSGTSAMTGTVTVAEGRLAFNGANGKFTKIRGVIISGGTLVVDNQNRLPEEIEYWLSGGKLEIATGVHLHASAIYVSDGNGGWIKKSGPFTATNHPEYISGGGLVVAKPGLRVIIK